MAHRALPLTHVLNRLVRMLSLTGKGVLIVGAKRVGQVVAERLAAEGVNIAVSYRSSRREAQQLVTSLKGKAKRTCLVQADVSVEADIQRLVDTAVQEMGNLWFVVNLASGYPSVKLAHLDGKAWDEGISAAKGSYLLTAYAGRHMAKHNRGNTRGHIILFGDWAAGETPYRNFLPYLTAKAAIQFMTRAFAVEFAPHVLVNAIAPGPTARPPDVSPESWRRDVLAHAPLRRQSSSEEIAELVVTLLRSETITGDIIHVDAGRHVAGPGPASD
ncbi:MAG: SDR family oxidoreductase [Dehalococcoidia bacterium]|nr:SDR family oxidoreductase [Dehalococcoidia bacterium]